MEFIFECFFKDTFEKLSRNGLHDCSSRRDVLDHLNAIIGGCSDGQNVPKEEVARIAVLTVIEYHQQNKNLNGGVCLMGKFHNILYIAIRTCWDWSVRDSDTVGKLLDEIYSCEKTFERLFLGALFGSKAPYFIAGWRSDFRDQNENMQALVYFLKHASKIGMVLPVWLPHSNQEYMIRFIDIPIESCGKSTPLRVALQACMPEMLLILLRFGANHNPCDGGTNVVLALLDKLAENANCYSFNMVLCLHIILRTIPRIDMPYPHDVYSVRRDRFLEKYGCLLIDNIINKKQVFGVMSLRHLCRCYIRNLLHSNGQLPAGIDTLKLPRRLHRYIDLMEELENSDPNETSPDMNKNEPNMIGNI